MTTRLFLAVFAALALLFPATAFAQQTSTTKVVATCGTAGYVAGKMNYPTQDTTGAACGSGAGSGVVCNLHALYDASDNGKKTVVAGTASKKIYVCGYILATGGTATNLSLTSGTGSDCASTSVAITPAYQLVANDRVGVLAAAWTGLITLANADNLCVNASAGNAHQVEIWYAVL